MTKTSRRINVRLLDSPLQDGVLELMAIEGFQLKSSHQAFRCRYPLCHNNKTIQLLPILKHERNHMKHRENTFNLLSLSERKVAPASPLFPCYMYQPVCIMSWKHPAVAAEKQTYAKNKPNVGEWDSKHLYFEWNCTSHTP